MKKMNEIMKFPDGTELSGQIRVSGHFCIIKNPSGAIPEDTSLIRLQTATGAVYGKIEGYTTVYKTLDDGVILSNDGSVYQEPEPVEPYVPTLAELQDTKKAEVSAACEQIIYAGITVQLTDGPEHFSLTEKDQINLFGKQAQLAAGADQLEYHQDGHPCRYYSAAEMQQIVTAAMEHVSYHTTYCNSLNMWISGTETAEELETIFYGADIPEEYQSEVLKDYLIRIMEGVDEAAV
jgi:hypothetical protein